MADITMTLEEYDALRVFARRGATTPDAIHSLDTFIASIEVRNGIVRSSLWVQWQEADQPLPPTVEFPETWPPELRAYVTRTDRPIAKVDVQALVDSRARSPVNILVTPDPAGLIGWTALNVFFLV